MRPGMRVAQLLNIAFDMGAWETLGSLYNGCTLCLRGNTSKEWAALLKTVDVVISTPSILARHDPANYPSIKHVIVGGEPCPQGLPRPLLSFPHTALTYRVLQRLRTAGPATAHSTTAAGRRRSAS
jgi:hypothetical protein